MRLYHTAALSFLLTSFPSLISADVEFTAPAAGASIRGGSTFTVSWKDSGDAPSISDLTSYQLFLFSGSNAAPFQLTLLEDATFAAGNSITATVPATLGGSGTNV